MLRRLQAVQKLVLAELRAADRVSPMEDTSHCGGSHRLPVQQGSGGIGDGHAGASARDRHWVRAPQVVVEAEFTVLQRKKTHSMRIHSKISLLDYIYVPKIPSKAAGY